MKSSLPLLLIIFWSGRYCQGFVPIQQTKSLLLSSSSFYSKSATELAASIDILEAGHTILQTADNDMIQLLISQPTPRPESINELWFAIWNCFVVVPAAIAALEAPVGKGQPLPATPFLSGSAFFGYFALGPYFATRTV